MKSDEGPSYHWVTNYWDIFLGLVFGFLAFLSHNHGLGALATLFSALSIASLSVTVAEIAEILAEKLGEPYGSFVLTFSAVAVEILLLLMILMQISNNPEAVETVKGGIISAVIVDMNVLLGLAIFIGGLSFKEQEHNENTSNSYTTILLVTSSALLVPSVLQYINTDPNATLNASILISILLFTFYIVIYIFQTRTHSHYFKATARSRIFRIKRKAREDGDEDDEESNYLFDKLSIQLNLGAIFILILLIGYQAEIFARDGLVIFNKADISVGLAGLIIAIISVSPEIFTAIKAAKNDQIQRVINIAMGASTVSILITVPVLMLFSIQYNLGMTLDFNSLQIGALILTIILAWKTTQDGETNYFSGISHLMFFLSYAVIAAFY